MSVVELEKQYLLQNYGRHPLVLERGDGPYMWDTDGKRYLDFIAGIGVNALGQPKGRHLCFSKQLLGKPLALRLALFRKHHGLGL